MTFSHLLKCRAVSLQHLSLLFSLTYMICHWQPDFSTRWPSIHCVMPTESCSNIFVQSVLNEIRRDVYCTIILWHFYVHFREIFCHLLYHACAAAATAVWSVVVVFCAWCLDCFIPPAEASRRQSRESRVIKRHRVRLRLINSDFLNSKHAAPTSSRSSNAVSASVAESSAAQRGA